MLRALSIFSPSLIRSLPAGGGTAVQVTRNGGYTAVESTDGQTLYYTLSEEGRSHEFAGGRSHAVGGVEESLLNYGLAVSPDRRTFLFTKYTDAGDDLMLIENFR